MSGSRTRIALPFLFGALAVFAGESPFVGHVIAHKGKWIDLRDGRTVDKGYGVFGDSRLAPTKQPPGGDSISIRFYHDGSRHDFDCGKLPCSDGVDLKPYLPPDAAGLSVSGFFGGLRAVLTDLGASEGHARTLSGYARALSKAAGSAELSDGVIQLLPEGPDLAPLFTSAEPGEYRVELCPVGLDGALHCPAEPAPIEWNWTGGAAKPFPGTGLAEGLYEVRIYTRKEGGLARSGSPAAALLLKSRAEVEEARGKYEQAVAAAKDWDRSEATLALRAYLQSLALSRAGAAR